MRSKKTRELLPTSMPIAGAEAIMKPASCTKSPVIVIFLLPRFKERG